MRFVTDAADSLSHFPCSLSTGMKRLVEKERKNVEKPVKTDVETFEAFCELWVVWSVGLGLY